MIKSYRDFINSLIIETSKYKSIESDNFIRLFNKIVAHFKELDKSTITEFKVKLFEYVSQDQSDLYPINFFDKEYKKLIDVINVLDNMNAKIILHKNKKSVTNISLPDLKPVWKDDDKKIYVYRADNIFQSIALGKGTNFCISSDYKNPSLMGRNRFYEYMYSKGESDSYFTNQKSSIYFIKSLNQKPEYQTIAIDVNKDGSGFLYTDVRNEDKRFEDYKSMIEDNNTSTDLYSIPSTVFKFVPTKPTKEEIFIFDKYQQIFPNISLIVNNKDKDFSTLLKEYIDKIANETYSIGLYVLKNPVIRQVYSILGICINRKKYTKVEIALNLLMDISEYTTYSAIYKMAFESPTKNNIEILSRLDRKYKIFLITLMPLILLDEDSIDEIIINSGLNNKDYYRYMNRYKSIINSVDDIKLSEIKELIMEKPDPYKDLMIFNLNYYFSMISKLIEKYGESILNLYNKK
jgi:hypothetical protein